MNASDGEKRPRPNHLQLRWKNFRSFEDTGWFELRPITIILGANNSGKTNLIRPLLLLKQTLDSGDENIALKITGPLADMGTYRNVVYQRNPNRTFELSIRFHTLETNPENNRSKFAANRHPSTVVLEFGIGTGPLDLELRRFEVQDMLGRNRLARKRTASGSYSLSTDLTFNRRILPIVKSMKPSHFAFSTFDVVRRVLNQRARAREALKKGKKTQAARTPEPKLPEKGDTYFDFLAMSEVHVEGALSRISYVGPLREYPRRYYESAEEVPETVGVRGELAPQVLYLTKKNQTRAKTNEWLKKFGLARRISCDPFHEDLFALKVTDLRNKSIVDYSDSGFGLSQLLPLIVQVFHSGDGGILFLEQPEIHLNPGMQSQLANLFAEASKERKTLIVETHSEHLVLRIRALIAERELRPEDVALYYVEKSRTSSSLREIPIGEDGHIESEKWPAGFFEEALTDALRLARKPRNRVEARSAT